MLDSWLDNYRDLVSAALALFCAGVMLVAGHLWIEWRARQADPGLEMEVRQSEEDRLPVISNGLPPSRKIEVLAEPRNKRAV
ncbi:hypothetical protein ML401_23585 [Bradyrhizobium sp. 62B]|uniref:hypothetical protein n=1 Tax=Bradyrhizobium sp. 62B TaxID=2898442 RepID=UPI0025582F91|nr:hypothetical protein ML401_23585 [Bradyrhizobium sp. 62B]